MPMPRLHETFKRCPRPKPSDLAGRTHTAQSFRNSDLFVTKRIVPGRAPKRSFRSRTDFFPTSFPLSPGERKKARLESMPGKRYVCRACFRAEAFFARGRSAKKSVRGAFWHLQEQSSSVTINRSCESFGPVNQQARSLGFRHGAACSVSWRRGVGTFALALLLRSLAFVIVSSSVIRASSFSSGRCPGHYSTSSSQ